MRINRTTSFFVALSLLASTVVALSATANAAGNPNCNAVDGDYIVSFAPGVNVDNEIKSAPGRAISAKFKYKFALNGFAANLSAEQVCAFQRRPNIENVELNATVTADVMQTWGLDRIDSNSVPKFDDAYTYLSTGLGVTAYVIDTGIYKEHTEFTGRLTWLTNTVDTVNNDCNGHGTHVAGTIGGTTYGVAKSVNLVAVKVLDCTGSGSTLSVTQGIEAVIADHVDTDPAVANMSLGGGASTAIDNAVKNLIADNVVVVVAAGNSSTDACKTSPARVSGAITVAASDVNDLFASFSNRGACVDIVAPGVDILSSYVSYNAKNSTFTPGTARLNGTSMASPHVAGAVARYLTSTANFTTNTNQGRVTDLINNSPTGFVKPPKGDRIATYRLLYTNPTK